MLSAHCRWGMEALHICTPSWPCRVGDELLDNLPLDCQLHIPELYKQGPGVAQVYQSPQIFVLFPVLI